MATKKKKQSNSGLQALKWPLQAVMQATFLFEDPTVAPTLTFSIFSGGGSDIEITGFIGDLDFSDDVARVNRLKADLMQAPETNQFLRVFLRPRERSRKPFKFSVVFFTDEPGTDEQIYNFASEDKPIVVRIPVEFT